MFYWSHCPRPLGALAWDTARAPATGPWAHARNLRSFFVSTHFLSRQFSLAWGRCAPAPGHALA
eukprot:1193972-Pyramimonas_sp.AAC.1